MLQLNDKVAIVTGAGRGNGRGVAMALADHGAAVMVCDINEENAKNVAKEINESGGKAIAAYCDVTDPASVDAMVQKTLDELGSITTLINNAGVIYWKDFFEQTLEEFQREVKINLESVFICTKAVAKTMIENGIHGSIVNFSSESVTACFPEGIGYSASKGGVQAITLALAGYLAPHRIRVNSIAPGPTPTGMNTFMHENADKIGATIPLGRCGDCYKDHGHICCFLASDEYSGWITAENILVDGGKNMIPYIYDPKNAPVFNT